MSDMGRGWLTIGEPRALEKTLGRLSTGDVALTWRLGHRAPIL